MNAESALHERVAVHAALADPARLRIVDRLATGDASPSELARMLGMPSNLFAHHVKVLESAGLVARQRSEGDGRRHYLRLLPSAFDTLVPPPLTAPARVLFVCTANSARSQLAAALWRRASEIPSASAGTRPAERISAGAIGAAGRHQLPLPRRRPRHLSEVEAEGDLIVTVCDQAHEELGPRASLHWSVADPVRAGTSAAFDAAYDELSTRVSTLAPRLDAAA